MKHCIFVLLLEVSFLYPSSFSLFPKRLDREPLDAQDFETNNILITQGSERLQVSHWR